MINLWYQYKKGIMISLTILVLGFLGFVGYGLFSKPVFEVRAFPAPDRTMPNLRGWAWTETIGWISFSSETDPSATESYGVSYNGSKFEGYAWSDNVGWIDFNYGGADCHVDGNCYATYNLGDDKIEGWAKIISYVGSDGWISLGDNDTGDSIDFGINVSVEPINDIESESGDLFGWAWSGGTHVNGNLGTEIGLGWISFSCADTGNCAIDGGIDYGVTAKPTKPTILSVERTEGNDTYSLTIEWNSDVWFESDFDIISREGSTSYVKRDDLPVGSDNYEHDNLDINKQYYYKVKACNDFGCSVSSEVGGKTSPINIIGGSKIDSVCYHSVADSSLVNLAWSEPSGNGFDIASYELRYCVLEAGESVDDCSVARWKDDLEGTCSSGYDINVHPVECDDVLDSGRWDDRYNTYAYRVRAVGDDASKSCDGGTSSGDSCNDGSNCTDPVLCESGVCNSSYNNGADCSVDANVCININLCQPAYSSWSYFREIRPCPRQGQPGYQEVRPE